MPTAWVLAVQVDVVITAAGPGKRQLLDAVVGMVVLLSVDVSEAIAILATVPAAHLK